MRILRWIAVSACAALLIPLACCGPGPAPLPETVVTPTATRVPRPRVMVLSLGGAGDALVDRYIDEGMMPNLAALAERGAEAEYVITVDPSTTLAAHVSLASGSYPNQTNQVGDRYHLPETPVQAVVEGLVPFQPPVEPLWRAAMRHGLTTATLFWPGLGIDGAGSPADVTITRGAAELDSALHILTTTVGAEWQGAPPSYSPALEATLSIATPDGPVVLELAVLAIDSTDDQQENYDSVFLSETPAIGPESTRLSLGGWASFSAAPRLYGRGHIKLVSVTTEQIELYRTAMWYTRAEPAELLRDINARFGFCPPPPDDKAFERGWITSEEYWQMAERQNRWFSDVIAHVFDEYGPDLTLARLGITEEMGSRFLLSEEARWEDDSQSAELWDELLRSAYALADASVGDLLGHVVLGKDTILVVSDHGLAPAHTEVQVNTLLRDADMLGGGGGASVDPADTQAYAVASGGAVHIYVNLEGREIGGMVTRDEYGMLCEEVVDLLRTATDGDGNPVFSRVLLRGDLSSLHLDSFAAGDVFAQARPGFALSDAVDGSDAFVRPSLRAAAGYDASEPSMHAIMVAAGFGIQRGVKLPAVDLIDLAPTVAELLRVQQVGDIPGRVLSQMLRGSQ